MRFEIILSPGAARGLRAVSAFERATIKSALEVHLRHEPAKESRTRIKRLRGLVRPQFHLRVGEVRIFYDVTDKEVHIIAIVAKDQTGAWLEAHGEAAP